MNINKIKMVTTAIFTLLLTIGCEDASPTSNTTPESATIMGTITFSGEWPSNGDIAVSLNSDWPPQGAPVASLEITSTDIYAYTFENVTFGSYSSIAVSWQDPNDNNPATNQHILGAYGGVCPFFTAYGGMDPTTVTVSDTLYSLTGIDFTANLGYAVELEYCQ